VLGEQIVTTHVLVGTSPTDAARRRDLQELADQVGAELAFLQLATPTLVGVLDRLADAGTDRVVLVGVSGGAIGPGVSWLRRIASTWWRERGEDAPVIATASAFLTDVSQWTALVDHARPITHGGAGLTSPAWEDVPRHRRQVLVCRGPRCTASGSEDTSTALTLAMMGAGLGDDDVLVTQTGCQFPCNHAPVVTVQPDDVWYGAVHAGDVEAIVSGHLLSGEPVDRLRLVRDVR
jgi:(2Fe-2S) ferredoxin